MSYKEGSYSASDFKDEFGIERVDPADTYDVGAKNRSGKKNIKGVGTYMTEDVYERLKNSDKMWDVVRALKGDKAVENKKKKGYLDINEVDNALDRLSAGEVEELIGETETIKPDEIEMSPEYSHAKARAQQYTDDVTSGRTGKELFGEVPDSTSFLDRYKLHLGERLENGNYRPKQYSASDSSILDKNSSMLTSDEAAIAELTRTEKDPRKDY